ncbi:HK97 family phage prohead protease [Peptoniphilus sp. MSJ-1]|uniref:HK97 family phage prohead protease n=1 Tax=Peptoniphilus ovalis TaxID=2841503 RepID=A0ABS6FH65_9FIRM|nr:HK97 family phage prohead protease [Peptoniphilus ovalis]MBU5669522.1 HK97 family phage prohead protease [Peptoniphilus ovalis]
MKFTIPIDIKKSQTSPKEMRICGLASTPDLDRENQSILQKGLDISEFVNHGFFNLDHDNSVILGYPDKAKTKITDRGLYVEGTLLDTPKGKDIWDSAVALEKSGANRKLGFSVEGKILKKDNRGNILKAKIYNVAITPNPVNPKATWTALYKSMSKALNIDSGAPLMKESLENASKCIVKAINGDKDLESILEKFINKLRHSQDKDDIELYLALTKGISGKSANIISNILEEKVRDNIEQKV